MNKSYPSAPLFEKCRGMSDKEISDQVGVTRKTVGRWRHGANVAAFVTDDVAIALGAHPLELWPDWVAPPTPRFVHWTPR